MFAPRARTHHDENALATRTPAPSTLGPRSTVSPLKSRQSKAVKASEGGPASISPKKLFKSVTPAPSTNKYRFALGDKTNNNKNPFYKGNEGGKSSSNSGSKSPTRIQRTNPYVPPKTPGPDESLHVCRKMASRTIQRAQSFETPASNIGRKGMMKQRLGELMDAQRMMASGTTVTPGTTNGAALDEKATHWTDGLTEEEIFPEIEYLPPSMATIKEEVWEMPDQLESLPRAKELAAKLAKPNFARAVARQFKPPSPLAAPDIDVAAFEAVSEGKDQRQKMWSAEAKSREEQEDDPYPDQLISVRTAENCKMGTMTPTSVVSSRSSVANGQNLTMPRRQPPQSTPVLKKDSCPASSLTASHVAAPSSQTSSQKHAPNTASLTAASARGSAPSPNRGRAPSAKLRSNPTTVALPRTARPTTAARVHQRSSPPGEPATQSGSTLSSLLRARGGIPSSEEPPSASSEQRLQRRLHPALRDLCNDDLGKDIDARLAHYTEKELALGGEEDLRLNFDSDNDVSGENDET